MVVVFFLSILCKITNFIKQFRFGIQKYDASVFFRSFFYNTGVWSNDLTTRTAWFHDITILFNTLYAFMTHLLFILSFVLGVVFEKGAYGWRLNIIYNKLLDLHGFLPYRKGTIRLRAHVVIKVAKERILSS